MYYFNLGIVGTLFLAVIVLLIGRFLQHKILFLQKFFIPSPVIGGIIISIILSILTYFNLLTLEFDITMQKQLMIAFFATVGFSASFKFLLKGGKAVILFLICAITLVILQNTLGVILALSMNQSYAFGIATGSVSLTGGHGTSAAFSPLLSNLFSLANATEITISAATFGLIAGSLLGGPIGRKLMKKYRLKPDVKTLKMAHVAPDLNEEKPLSISEKGIFHAVTAIVIAMTLGEMIAYYLNQIGFILPPYIGAMLAAALIRNIADISQKIILEDHEITVIGNICLYLFLAMVLMSMNLISLVDIALPMLIILLAQVLLMALFAYHVTFRIMGRNYDAAVLAVGHCGFGLGATPNAMANMEAFTNKNYPSPLAFFTIPIVGSLFIDFANAGIITGFLNFLKMIL